MTNEWLADFETPYIPFPNEPRALDLEGKRVWEYITPEIMEKLLSNLSDRVKLKNFDHVMVNMKGGIYLFSFMAKKQEYDKSPIKIAIHRPVNGHGALIETDIPQAIKDIEGSNTLLIEDVLDTGGVLNHIFKETPKLTVAAVIKKRGVPDQAQVKNTFIAVEGDDVWYMGCGMNGDVPGDGYPRDFLRRYPGIVAKPIAKPL